MGKYKKIHSLINSSECLSQPHTPHHVIHNLVSEIKDRWLWKLSDLALPASCLHSNQTLSSKVCGGMAGNANPVWLVNQIWGLVMATSLVWVRVLQSLGLHRCRVQPDTQPSVICGSWSHSDLSLSLLAVSHCSEPEEKRWQFHTGVWNFARDQLYTLKDKGGLILYFSFSQ